jgi:hypothetical protein
MRESDRFDQSEPGQERRDGDMQQIDPQLAAAFVATTGVGFLMMVAGVHKSMLEWRNKRRHCPSCGRLVDGRVCQICTHTG